MRKRQDNKLYIFHFNFQREINSGLYFWVATERGLCLIFWSKSRHLTQTGISYWILKFFSQAEMKNHCFISSWQWGFRLIIKQRHGGGKKRLPPFISYGKDKFTWLYRKEMQKEGRKCTFAKWVYCIFLLIKILFLDFKSKLGGTHVKEQDFFVYSKLPWDVTYSHVHRFSGPHQPTQSNWSARSAACTATTCKDQT